MKRIDVLPDDVLLGIFDFYVDMSLSLYYGRWRIEAWQSLVHVCRRWRSLVLASPRRLNLQIRCTPDAPARDKLDVWPALPLIVDASLPLSGLSDTDNIIAALGQSNRVCKVDLVRLNVDLLRLQVANRQLQQVLAPMQVPFPELTELRLWLISYFETPPAIPDSFLDGSAPRLRTFTLKGIPFPGLPKLLLSANHLVDLWYTDIPHSGYTSPEAIVAPLSVLPSLEVLSLGFLSPQSGPDWESRSLPPPKRSILPALRSLSFRGVTEYLEDLVTHIDTPQLDHMQIIFFNQIDFDCPRLAQFINRTPIPTLKALDEARVLFFDSAANVKLRSRTSKSDSDLGIAIPCREPDWQLSSIEQVCNSSLPPLSTVEDLYIERCYWRRVFEIDAIEHTLWLQLLLPFTAVKNLYLSEEFAPGIAAALQELVGGRITEALPSLQNIFVQGLKPSGPFQENIGQFVAARQLSDHPIAISGWDKDSHMHMEWV